MPITLGYLLPNVYSRHDDTTVRNKNDELFLQLKKITSHAFSSTEWDVIEYLGDNDLTAEHLTEGDKFQCICSCYELQRNFIVQHVPTKIMVTVGSLCITKFGDKSLCTKRNAVKRNNKCIGGKLSG